MTWIVIGFLIIWIRWKFWSAFKRRLSFFFMAFLIFVVNTATLPRLLHQYLEDQYPPIDLALLDPKGKYNIIVLGGGQGYDDRLPATSLLEWVSLARLVEGIRIFKKLPNSRLITSGYSSIGRKPQAEVAKDAAIILGVPDSSIIAQGIPSNTIEEAETYVSTFGSHIPVIVVTSAIHIPRAIEIFKRKGINKIIAAPAVFMVKKQNPISLGHYLSINFSYMHQIASCLHEIVGLWYIRLVH